MPSTYVPSNANATSIPKWEYKEILIDCRGLSSSGDHCLVDDELYSYYPNRTAVLNELAKQGWEVIYFGIEYDDYTYGLRRPIIGE